MGALFWDRIYEAGSKCQEKKANFSEGAPEELKGVVGLADAFGCGCMSCDSNKMVELGIPG